MKTHLQPLSYFDTFTIQSLSPQPKKKLMSTTARSRNGYQKTHCTVSNWTPSTQDNAVSSKPIIKIKRHVPSPGSKIVIQDMQSKKSKFADWFSQDPVLGALDADMSFTLVSKRSKNSKDAKKYTTFAIEPSFMKKLARKK